MDAMGLLDAARGGAWWPSTIRSVVSDTLGRWPIPFDRLLDDDRPDVVIKPTRATTSTRD
jgi:hypothetical protein